ncbi:MAG: DUF86 domain-containing protein [Planctomycetota bacterium]|nr:DUF86 domain-containing protein [Planctomycetota bacterium]
MKRDISIYLKDAIENMEQAEAFIKNITYNKFAKDRKTHYAVIRCIEVIGEAIKHIPESIRQKYPHVPWKDMAGMRDKVIHFYFGVNLKRVWQVVKNDIPRIKPHIKTVLKELQSKTG